MTSQLRMVVLVLLAASRVGLAQTPTPTPAPVTVSLPNATFDTSVPISSIILEPVMTTNIDSSLGYVGFQADMTFDSAVVSFPAPPATPVQTGGLTAGNWGLSGNIINSGPGTIKTLRVSAFSNDFTPLQGSGVLYRLRMIRVSSTPGDMSPLVWAAPPNNFLFIDSDLNTFPPTQVNGLITITPPPNPTPTPTPTPTVSISGNVSYCSNPAAGPVPNVTLAVTGDVVTSTLTDNSGNYIVSVFIGGNYDVTPSKAARTPGSAGINTIDVVAVQRHFLNIALLSGCRLMAADVNGDNAVNTSDVIAIKRFFLGLTDCGEHSENEGEGGISRY